MMRVVSLIAVFFSFLSFTASSAVSQGFMVEPMRMHISAPAGEITEVMLRIRNTSGDGPGEVDISLAELTQRPNGSWSWRAAHDGYDLNHESTLEWSSVSTDSIAIPPLEPAEVLLRISPPRNARGSYYAALLVESPAPPEGTPGISIRTRFVIPVILEIQGRPVRQDVQPQELEMIYDQGDENEPTTRAYLQIHNAGQTYSSVTGYLRIERRSANHWQLVTRFEMRERPIIPGVTLELGQDLERRLPSGEYRLRADVRVDGRRLPPLQREIYFEGDPNVDAVAYDTELRLTPGMVQMDVVPGATRTTILRIENPGEDAVTVNLGAATPRGLLGVRLGDLIGAELSAEPWTSVRPAQFTLRGKASQNVRVISSVPSEEELHANYYADLALSGTYGDGQSAGQQSSVVHLVNRSAETQRQGLVEMLSLAEAEPNVFAVQARFLNTGNTHVVPLARVAVNNRQGQSVRNATLTGTEGMLLPLGQRTFGGEIDFSGVEPGVYALRANVELEDGKSANLQHVIEVQVEDVQTDDGTVQQARVTVLENAAMPEPEVDEQAVKED